MHSKTTKTMHILSLNSHRAAFTLLYVQSKIRRNFVGAKIFGTFSRGANLECQKRHVNILNIFRVQRYSSLQAGSSQRIGEFIYSPKTILINTGKVLFYAYKLKWPIRSFMNKNSLIWSQHGSWMFREHNYLIIYKL